MHIHLQTAHLTIRRFTAADEDNLVDLNSDPEVMRYLTGGLPVPGRDEIRDDDVATGQFLGWFHLRPRRADGAIDLGYRLRRAVWGLGYATDGSRALIDKGFIEHDIDRIVAETMTVNLASRRVLEKSGLRYLRTYFPGEPDHIEGADQGDVEYQLTRAGWAAARR